MAKHCGFLEMWVFNFQVGLRVQILVCANLSNLTDLHKVSVKFDAIPKLVIVISANFALIGNNLVPINPGLCRVCSL